MSCCVHFINEPAYFCMNCKTCLRQPISKRPKIVFQYLLSLNAGQKYCRMLQGEHSVILSTFIKLPIVFKTFVFSYLCSRFKQILLYRLYAQKPPLSVHADESSRARRLKFGFSLYLYLYFVYASSEDSGEFTHVHRLA